MVAFFRQYVLFRKEKLFCFVVFCYVFHFSLSAREHEISGLLEKSNKTFLTDTTLAMKQALQAMDLAHKSGSNEMLSNVSLHLGMMCEKTGQNNKALAYYEASIEYANETGKLQLLLGCLKHTARLNLRIGNYNKSLEYYSKARKLAEIIKDENELSILLINLGLTYSNLGNYPRAIEVYLKALDITEKLNSSKNSASVLINIGNVYYYLKNYPKALPYYRQAFDIAREIDDNAIIKSALNNIGEIYRIQGDYYEAMLYFEQSLELAKKYNDTKGEALVYFNFGLIKNAKKKYREALDYFEMSIDIYRNMGLKKRIAATLNEIGKTQYFLNNYPGCVSYCSKALVLAEEIGSKEIVRQALGNLSDAYAAKYDYQKAYEYHLLFKNMHDSIFNEENQRKLKEMEFEKKEVKYQGEIKRQQLQRNYLIIGISVLLILVFYILRSSILRRRAYMQIAAQKQVIEEKNNLLEKQKEEITDSIVYAERIQSTILPETDVLTECFSDHFIYYKPRDIVSGDFYWVRKENDSLIVAVADCTGHGVPGAFMSILGISLLNEICNESIPDSAADFLFELRGRVKSALHQKNDETENRDGLDISLCIVDLKHKKMHFSGAFNSLFMIRDGRLKVFKADRQPIGVYFAEKGYTNYDMAIQKGDIFYLLTDGFADQIGGSRNKKYLGRNLQELLTEIHHKSMAEQMKELDKAHLDWKKDNRQMDDICILGLKV
jgi:tetratricopeptide (TPR) repeat protein